jgi:hypothetical protein
VPKTHGMGCDMAKPDGPGHRWGQTDLWKTHDAHVEGVGGPAIDSGSTWGRMRYQNELKLPKSTDMD